MTSKTKHLDTLDTNEMRKIALEHGVNIDDVIPPERSEWLGLLKAILQKRNVRFPIPPDVAVDYYRCAESGEPFGIGSLSGETVNLHHYANAQEYESLTLEDHVSWACLVHDQQATKRHFACKEYLQGEEMFEIGGMVIPNYYVLNARIFQQTGWQLATVSEIIPAEVFFHCHSHKFFPVTTFMRPLGTDYLEEPDIGHDVAGHVATFTIPQVAQVMNNHGLANDMIHREKTEKLNKTQDPQEIARIHEEANELLLYAGRLYWFTVEFGLVMQNGELKVFGAGILSSPGETKYSVDSPESNRVLIDPSLDWDLLRLATTDYLISEFQKTYFVMKDFETLTSLTPERILDVVHKAQRLPHHTWREVVPGDHVLNVGRCVTSSNEKYFRLLANQPLDQCMQRAAIRNLRLIRKGVKPASHAEREFLSRLPEFPDKILEEFAQRDRESEFNDLPTPVIRPS
ncbi:MAG TPA: hypothetical protein PKD64_08550 [Pirellulaceae bacterium]|nr:hypothetical protein [Pirellulaceae bacterium]HMO92236.1 hypothetical protein [Pirellulaceae bacterium]HMP70745.1 hypothetical protein [Pirellulaceae bacterium]